MARPNGNGTRDWDVLIQGGTLVDGTGAPPFRADLALSGARIAALAPELSGRAQRTLDARGLTVMPGFVDIHTHYDGQATWDAQLAPSCYHGVTSAVMGNCGVGFAPVAPGRQKFLIELMEGVEDIPGAALSEGIAWEWESFPEYLDALARRRFSMDVATQVPHGALRAYVMGERGANNEPATRADIARMAALVKEGVRAGALGFSTSRTLAHRAISGEPVPGTFAAEDELFGIGRVLGELGAGVFEVAGAGVAGEDIAAPKAELEWMRRLSREIARPVTFALVQVDAAPGLWRELLALSKDAAREGAQLFPQVAGRPFGMLIGHQTTLHPFADRAAYAELLALPFEARIQKMRDPERKRRILAKFDPATPNMFLGQLGRAFPMGDPPNYEPAYEDSVEARALAAGREPVEYLYDLLLEKDGRELLLLPILNYSELSAEPIREMFFHPNAALGLGDGGAHCGMICDASIQTFMLTHWVKGRTRGARVPLEFAVKRMTSDTAQLYGLCDRGVLRAGQKADLNIVDLDALALLPPEMAHDLPAGGKRFLQRARGYRHTFVSGVEVLQNDEATGEFPGRLVRGAQPALA